MEAQARSPLQWIKGPGIATAAVDVTAVAGIQSLVQEFPYATSTLVKKNKKQKPVIVGNTCPLENKSLKSRINCGF